MESNNRARVAAALVHYPVKDRLGDLRATSVTPLNIHDLARSSATYGISPLYAVTPLLSQQALVKRILKHWLEGYGGVQNPSRRRSLEAVSLVSSVNDAAADLFRRTGAYPRLVGTGARPRGGSVGYGDLRERIDREGGVWLILFGTGWGLSAEFLDQCDALLEPLSGPGEFNHLSVRAAAAIILDRLFGS